MKNKTKFLVTTLFILVAFFLLGTTDVNATTVEVETEQQLIEAVDGIKEVDGSKVSDTDTTVVKLVDDIELTKNLGIKAITDLTLDLNGHSLSGETNSKDVYIMYGSNTINSGSLTIKDTSVSNLGTIKSYKPIIIYNYSNDTSASYKLTIDGGKFYNLYWGNIFELSSSNYALDFTVNDGYFEYNGTNPIFLHAGDMITNNRTLKVKLDKLTMKGNNTRLVYSSEKDFKASDVVSEDSNIKLKDSILNTEGALLSDRNVFVNKLNALKSAVGFDFDTIEITKKEGFDVSDVTLNETYGYSSATAKGIEIKNRGTSDLKIKNVTVNSADFEVEGTAQPTLTAGATDNTSYKIKPKTGLNAGTYTATVTVTDANDETYTSTVKVIVAKKEVEGLGVGYEGDWQYGETPTTLNKYGVEDLTTEQYVVDYSVHDANDWSLAVPTLAGYYDVRIRVVDTNYNNSTISTSTFTIEKNNKEIQIIANSNEWTYDGNSHSDGGYTVKYDGTEITDGVLPTGDTITALVNGSVIDVVDTVAENNVVDSYNISNKECYSNITTTKGTLTIKPITTTIYVSADSDSKEYDGTPLTKNSFTYTEGVLLAGDELTATVTGSLTYVDTTANFVSDIKVMRGSKDITSNYTIGTPDIGKLEVRPIYQPLAIADQYVRTGSKLLTSELEQALSGAYGNVSFEVKSGTAGEYNDELYGGFLAGSSIGDVVMTVKADYFDVNSDGYDEYLRTEKDFIIHVVTKENVTISGIDNNQEFTYDGNVKTPLGTLTVNDNKVDTSTLEVSYAGTGSTTYSSTTAPKNAGTYSVTYKVPSSNVNYVGEATFNFTIKKVQLPKVTIDSYSFPYTGEVITTSPINFDIDAMSYTGDVSATDVDTYAITISLKDTANFEWADGTTTDLTLNWSITKATPSYTVPTNLTGLRGQTLDDIELPTGFTWNDISTALVVGAHKYKATYTPSDTHNYNIIDNIDITVVTKDMFNVTTSVIGGNGTISTSYLDVVECTTKEIIFTPNTGFMINKVLVNDVETSVTDNKLTLTVNENKDVKVSYKKIPFRITVVDTEGATITPNGSVTVNYGDTHEFTITTNAGYKFIKVLVNDVETSITDNKLTLNNITDNMTVKVVVEKIVYDVIEGAGLEYTVDKDSEARFRIDADYSKFEVGGKVYIDGELVDEENYTSKSGSTIIIFRQSFINSLSAGPHTLRVVFNDGGESTTNFRVSNVAEGSNPTTLDNIMIYVTVAIMSVVGIGATVVIRKKQVN